MQMDFKNLRIGLDEYMDTQNRFTKLKRENADKAAEFYRVSQEAVDKRHEK